MLTLSQIDSPSPSTLLDKIPQLEDDISATPFLQESFWTLTNSLLALGGLILIIALAIYLYSRHQKAKIVSAPAADVLALRALDALERSEPEARELSLGLSLILREYITQETQEPTLYETHQEFSNRLDSLASIPAEQQYKLRCLLDELAEIKYAQLSPLQLKTPFTRARALIEAIAQQRREEEESKKKLLAEQSRLNTQKKTA